MPCWQGASQAGDRIELLEKVTLLLPHSSLTPGGAPGGSRHRAHLKYSAVEGPGSEVYSRSHQDPRLSHPLAPPVHLPVPPGQLAAAAPFSTRPESAWRAQYRRLPALSAAGTLSAPDAFPGLRTGGLGEERARQSPLTHPEDEVKSEEQVFDALATSFDRHGTSWSCVGQEARTTGTEGTRQPTETSCG